jgi:hypothetical protein
LILFYLLKNVVTLHGFCTGYPWVHPHSLTQNAKLKNGPGCSYRTQRGDPMDKYDVIGMVIAIVAVSVVLMH